MTENMQIYKMIDGEYSQLEQLQFDVDKKVEAIISLRSKHPFEVEKAKKEIERLTLDIEERTLLIINEDEQNKQ